MVWLAPPKDFTFPLLQLNRKKQCDAGRRVIKKHLADSAVEAFNLCIIQEDMQRRCTGGSRLKPGGQTQVGKLFGEYF